LNRPLPAGGGTFICGGSSDFDPWAREPMAAVGQ
jgi:hypothetical protein